jgi:hypothetical protein
MNSNPSYTAEQIARAQRDKAPADAIYRQQDGTWRRYAHVTEAQTRAVMDRLIPECGG